MSKKTKEAIRKLNLKVLKLTGQLSALAQAMMDVTAVMESFNVELLKARKGGGHKWHGTTKSTKNTLH